MMKKYSLVIVFIFFSNIFLFGQFNPRYSFLEATLSNNNPGVVGFGQGICATALSRNQWLGLDGAPKTTLFAVNSPLRLIGVPGGVGISLYDDKAGLAHNFNIKAQYSLHTYIAGAQVGIGVGAGLTNLSYSGTWTAPDGAEGDISIPTTGEARLAFDLQTGLFFIKDNLNLGVSIDHLTSPNINFYQKNPPFLARHFYLYGSYFIDISAININLIPRIQIITDASDFQLVTNLIAKYNNKFFGGLSYNFGDVSLLAGFSFLDGLELGLTYGIATNKIAKFSSEVFIRYCFDIQKDKKPRSYKSVRFL